MIGGVSYSFPDFIVKEPDYHLLPGSPAVDAGESVDAPPADIAGGPRPCGHGDEVDIGAYEYCASDPGDVFVRGDINADGARDISDPVFLLSHLFTGGEAPGCLDAADADDSGTLDITDAVYLLGFLFLGGPAPRPPYTGCGIDPIPEDPDLGCNRGCP